MAHRNGYEPRAVKTASGVVELQRPRIRNAEALGFESLVLGKGVTHALESLVVCSFLRGLSVDDVEAALEETFEEQIVSRAPCRGSVRTAASATGRGAAWVGRAHGPPARRRPRRVHCDRVRVADGRAVADGAHRDRLLRRNRMAAAQDWQAAGVWEHLHRELLRRLNAARLIDWTRAIVD